MRPPARGIGVSPRFRVPARTPIQTAIPSPAEAFRMHDPSIRMRLDFVIGLLGLLVIGVGFQMVLMNVAVGLAFFLVVLLVGVVALRSYLLTWESGGE